jgi:hypothetical protein
MPGLPEDGRALALMLPETVEGVHWGRPDFCVGHRLLATIALRRT